MVRRDLGRDEPTKAEGSRDQDAPRNDLLGPGGKPRRIGHYEVIRRIGQGGMGIVYLARDKRLGRRVALKLLLKVDPTHRARFLAEAQTTARLSHENIVALYDIGEEDGLPYLVLEYVPGRTLSAWLKERRAAGGQGQRAVPPVRVAELMLPVARALAAAHEAGIVHRDLKPANVMLADSGAVKVLDFGIAKLVGASAMEDPLSEAPADGPVTADAGGALTHTGLAIGTHPYMAPEQWRGQPVDGRTDLWAAGMMMFEMVTGQHPLAPLTVTALRDAAIDREPMPSIRDLCPDVGRLGVVIDRCLLKPMASRLESARDLCEELEHVVRPHAASPRDDGEVNPYAGLSAFEEKDAAQFFGRETAVEHLAVRLQEEPLLALVGPSGAGKSSLARAGLIPALKRAGDNWESFVIRPGPHPLGAITDVLRQGTFLRSTEDDDQRSTEDDVMTLDTTSTSGELALSSGDRGDLQERLRREPGFFGVRLRGQARRRLCRVLLFVDQFEEVFTLAAEDDRDAFLTCLAGAADDQSSPVRVVIAIRQDFLDRVASSSAALAERVSRGTVLVGPLDRNGLRRALVEPAMAQSYQFDSEALLREMLDELAGAASALPLLQFTASRLWERRDEERRVLTEQSYRAFGGVGGALATHADSVLASLGAAEQRSVRILLLRLVTPERTRAIVTRRELSELDGAPSDQLDRVLSRLVEARLLTLGGAGGDDSTVELVHESLIATWPALQRWLDDQQGDAHFRGRLRATAKEWETSGRTEGLLWRGEAAEEARRWRARQLPAAGGEVGAKEARYLAAVIAYDDRERRRRRRIVGTVIAALALVAMVVSILSLQSRRAAVRAEQQSARAEAEKKTAERAAGRARNATRIAVARQHQDDPTTVIALLREIEPISTPPGWGDLVARARLEPIAEAIIPYEKVWRASYHPDGERILAGSVDGMISAWGAGGEREILSLRAQDEWVTSQSWSPDGARILTTSTDKTARVWRADGTGEPLVLRGHAKKVIFGAWSPSGDRIATASSDGTVMVWRADGTGEPVVLRGHRGTVWRVGWSPDGTRLVSCSDDHTVRVWRADGTGEPLTSRDYREPITVAAWSPRGDLLLFATPQTVRLWSVDGKGEPLSLEQDAQVMDAAFSPAGSRLAVALGSNTVKVLSVDGKGPALLLRGHAGLVLSVAFRADGRRLLTASREGTLRVWPVEESALPIVLSGHTDSVQSAAFSPDGTRIVSSSSDRTVKLWNADGKGGAQTLVEHAGIVKSVAWSPNGERLVSASYDGSIKVSRADGRGRPIVLSGHPVDVQAASFSPDGAHIVSASTDKTVRVWRADGEGEPLLLRGHEEPALAASFSPDGKRIVSASADKTVRVWSADGSGQPLILRGHEGWVWSAAWSPDGARIVSAGEDRTLRVWRADGTGEPLVLRGHESAAYVSGDRAFSADGKRVLSSSSDGTIRIWNLDGSGEPAVLRAQAAPLSASFSPDGKRIVLGLVDNTLVVLSDLEPTRDAADPRLWTATSYCIPLQARQRLLDFPEEQSRADLERCRGARLAPER